MASFVGATLATTDANAYVVKRTSSGELVHWEGRNVDYTLDPSVERNVAGATNAVAHALDSWSGSVGAPDLVAHAPAADAPTAPGFDRKNGIFFVANGYAPAGRALAITVLTYDNGSGRILDADVIFNGSYAFAVLGNVEAHATPLQGGAHPSNTDGVTHDSADVPNDAIYDLHHVVAHELGHSLGMNDEMERRDALMYRYTSANDASLRSPASDDITGLAELYSTKLEGQGNGCGGATVAPKKPSQMASTAAMAGVFALLSFLMLRARSDRRARLGFVVASAIAGLAMMPSVAKKTGVAHATEMAPGQARARVLDTTTTMEEGLLKTTYKLATVACRASSCPKLGHGFAWGGTSGNIRQEVGGQYAPMNGDEVDVSFTTLPNGLAPLSQPLGAASSADSEVRALTPAQ